MAKGKIESINHVSNWKADDGTTYYYHMVEMANGDKGKAPFKAMEQYKVGETIEYDIIGDRMKILKQSTPSEKAPAQSGGYGGKAPRNYQSTGKRSPEDYLGFIYGYAKDIHIAEIQVTGKKVPLANLKKNVEEMYAHIQELLNS
jgi:hypothetical protein